MTTFDVWRYKSKELRPGDVVLNWINYNPKSDAEKIIIILKNNTDMLTQYDFQADFLVKDFLSPKKYALNFGFEWKLLGHIDDISHWLEG